MDYFVWEDQETTGYKSEKMVDKKSTGSWDLGTGMDMIIEPIL